MRKTTPMSFGELWSDFLSGSPTVAKKLAEAKIQKIWPEIVGPAIAAQTTSINVVKGVMYVKIASAVVRNEIFMRREELKYVVNQAVGLDVVNVIIIK